MSAEADFSPAVLDKARRVPVKDVREHESDSSVWFVRSSRTGTEHRVQFIASGDPLGKIPITDWITCTCQHGDVKVSTAHCYHAAAAYLLMTRKNETEGEDHGD